MADDTELHFNELSMGDAAKQLIRSITFDVGFMNMPPPPLGGTPPAGRRMVVRLTH